MLSRLRRGHVALVGEVGFVEAKQVLGIRMLLHVLANLGCTVGAIPTHRAEVHLVGVEPKGRCAVLVVSPVVGPRDSWREQWEVLDIGEVERYTALGTLLHGRGLVERRGVGVTCHQEESKHPNDMSFSMV